MKPRIRKTTDTPYRSFLRIPAKLEPSFDQSGSTCDTADQTDRTGSSTHRAVDLVSFVGAFFTFQCQLFRNVCTLATVLFQFRTGELGRGAVTACFDGCGIVTDSQVTYGASLSSATCYYQRRKKQGSNCFFHDFYLVKKLSGCIVNLVEDINFLITVSTFDGICFIHHFLAAFATAFGTLYSFITLNSLGISSHCCFLFR